MKKTLFLIRDKTVAILHHFLPGEKESGLAEALLIGYKDDLDKTLVQSYTNTGVVHISLKEFWSRAKALEGAIDHFLDMGRSATNVVGNAVASAVVARWEGQIEEPQPEVSAA